MPTLNDILTANGDYTPVSGYPVDDKYENDSPVINVYDRTIGEIVGDTSTSGENVSQYLTFRIPRHPDHYDLIENGTNIRILYRLEDDTGEDVVPVNVVANDDYIIFGWKIPLVVTVNPGIVTFIIHAYKSENNIITYHYKTLPKTYRILETMETDVVVPEIEMYNLAEAYARGTITDVFGHTRPVEEGEPGYNDNSKYYKELAGTSKIDAETAKNAAETAQVAAETAQQAAEDARDQAVAIVGGEYVSYGQTQSLNDTQKNKARENIGATGPNGYYPNMTVGLSENFVGTGEPTRRTFNYDTAGGSADISDGNAEIDKMYGDTVVWNQLVNGYGHTQSITFLNGKFIYSDFASGIRVLNASLTLISGHKYYAKASKPFNNVYVMCYTNDVAHKLFDVGRSNIDEVVLDTIVTCNYTASDYRLYVNRYGATSDTPVSNYEGYVMLFDLTQMFGAGNEPTTVEEFKAIFPKDYYPYDEGTLLNVNPAGIKTVGFNAYDKATGKAELIGGNQYQITGTYTSLSYSTGEVLTPDSTGCFTPTKTGELTVTGGGANTCVHLTWSGYRNGDYEDYWTRTRDINIQPYFPDGLKRAGTVYDEISKNKAIKRIGVVDLGSLNWGYESSITNVHFFTQGWGNASRPKYQGELICPIYVWKPNGSYSTIANMEMCVDNSQNNPILRIKNDAYTDAAAFKTAMSGVMLYYELETPVETQIDPPLNLLYQVSDFGTEQFLGAGATEPKTLPIIADIIYGANYRDTIKNLPKNYAKVKGYYPDLYTGLSDNLIDRKGNGTPQEISYRTSCGDDSIADDGNGIIQSIFGKTVVWNQLVNIITVTETRNGVTFTWDAQSQTLTMNGSNSTDVDYSRSIPNLNTKLGHIYLAVPYIVSGTYTSEICRISLGRDYTPFMQSVSDSGKIATASKNLTNAGVNIVVSADSTFDNLKIKYRIHDLTQMFGAGNEPSTLDDPRIEWIKDYANEYPEYNSGELISYNGSGIKTVGFNQWDEEWEVGGISDTTGANWTTDDRIRSKNYIPCFPNTSYFLQASASFAVLAFYDANKNFISALTSLSWGYARTTPTNCYFMRFQMLSSYGTTYKNDICINLSWSGYRNGEYEPYWSRMLNLPISTYFPDGMKSAGSVRDELTKDKAVKRIGVVDLGTLDWSLSGYAENSFLSTDMPVDHANPITNINTKGYVLTGESFVNMGDKTIRGTESNQKYIVIRDSSYTDAATFKAAMSGVMLYYELAEPIETTITPPLDLTYKVADFGTEESIAEGKSTPFNGIIKYSDDFTRGLVNMPKNYDTTASLDALAASLSAMLTSALDGTVTITRGEYDPATKKYEWSCQFTKNQVN